jgi:hypothetical protein
MITILLLSAHLQRHLALLIFSIPTFGGLVVHLPQIIHH